jgi:hypothetical protein
VRVDLNHHDFRSIFFPYQDNKATKHIYPWLPFPLRKKKT